MRSFLSITFLFLTFSLYSNTSQIPAAGRPERTRYISQFIIPNAIGAEIGVFSGSFSYNVLLKKNPKKLYLIDPWTFPHQPRFQDETDPNGQPQMNRMYQNVCDLFHPFENVEIIRERSELAHELFEDNYFDYVYIDGEHSYNAVLSDLTNYLPKIKVGGLLIGDDYGWEGIEPAVKDFLEAHSDTCIFVDAKVGQYVLQRIK